MKKRWRTIQPDEVIVDSLQQSLKINRTLCKVLAGRGIENYDQAKDYFRPQLSQLYEPYLLKDMDKAISHITTLFEKKEKILVFGDYDVDGTTSVGMLYQFLCKIYEPSLFADYIPHRYREGYGVSK